MIPAMLTDTQCKKAKPTDKPYKLTDGGGLHLLIKPNGSKLWQYRYKLYGKESTFAIGNYPSVSLSLAREKMAQAKNMVKEGISPIVERQAKKLEKSVEYGNTFESVAKQWLDKQTKTHSARSISNNESVLTLHILPIIGSMPIKNIKPVHILKILKTLDEAGKHNTAIKARQVASAVFRHGVVTLKCESDPSIALQGFVQRVKMTHARALTESEMQSLLCAFSAYSGRFITRELVLFQMLTFVRSNEAIQARWEHIDWDAKLWRLPADMMKMKRHHIVPLTDVALALLRSIKPLTEKWDWVFPGVDKRTHASSSGINAAIRYATGTNEFGIITSHDFRATASTWLHEHDFLHDDIEMQLAHAAGSKTSASYNHSVRLEQRRELMNWWTNRLKTLCPAVFVPRYNEKDSSE